MYVPEINLSKEFQFETKEDQVKFKLSIFIVFIITGCATQWKHSSKNQNEMSHDIYVCQSEAYQRIPTPVISNTNSMNLNQQVVAMGGDSGAMMGMAISRTNFMNNCMYSKGYYK